MATESPIKVYKIAYGWAARRDGYAVHGKTREEALLLLKEAEEMRREIMKQPYHWQVLAERGEG